MLEFLVIVCAFGALWPRAWWLCAIVGFLALMVGPRTVSCFDCCGTGYYIENPFRETQAVVTALLCIAAWRWCRVRPTKLPAVRRLALCAAIVTILGSLPFDTDSYDTYNFVRVALVSSIVLLACLVLEVRFHIPPLPTATARAAAPPPDRTGS